MITQNPFHISGYIAPGRMPEPIKPVYTYDSQEKIDRCLSCSIPPEMCHGQCEDTQFEYGGRGRPAKCSIEQVAKMIRNGMTDSFICRELEMSESTLAKKKAACRKAGLLF